MAEATAWNLGSPPDIARCCAGASHPTLFVDSEVFKLQSLMDSNYFTSVYMLPRRCERAQVVSDGKKPTTRSRHLLRNIPQTSHLHSFLPCSISNRGIFTVQPQRSYPRTLSDQLSQEMNLYAAANPHSRPVKVHMSFPAQMFTECYEAENKIKTDLTKMLEETDGGQTLEQVAEGNIRGLEEGHELITTDLMTRAVVSTTLGARKRGELLKDLIDLLLGIMMLLVMVFVRLDMDRRVKNWGRHHRGLRNEDSMKFTDWQERQPEIFS